MSDAMIPASILLYIAGATTVTNLLVNGIRTAVPLPPLVSFLGACVLGWVFVVLFAVANSVEMTAALWAASVIAGVLVGGASAGQNNVHGKTLPTSPPSADSPPPAAPTAQEIATQVNLISEAMRERRVMERLQQVGVDVPAPGQPAPGPSVVAAGR